MFHTEFYALDYFKEKQKFRQYDNKSCLLFFFLLNM